MNGNGDVDQQIVNRDFSPGRTAPFLAVSLRCHPGSKRTNNQDRIARYRVPLGELVLVADGVGGQADGGRAATIVACEYGRVLSAAPATSDPSRALQEATSSVSASLAQANSDESIAEPGMASTVALVLVHESTAYIGHIGDSRVYLARNGSLMRLTKDHSIVQQMVDHGMLLESQAESHPSSHILTRSLGQIEATLELSSHMLQHRDVLLLCSDGIWAYIPEETIAALLIQTPLQPAAVADTLQNLALEAGAPDNICIALLRVDSAPSITSGFNSIARRMGHTRSVGLYATIILSILLAVAAAVLVFGWRP